MADTMEQWVRFGKKMWMGPHEILAKVCPCEFDTEKRIL